MKWVKNNRPVAENKKQTKWEHLTTVCLSQQWSDNKYSQKKNYQNAEHSFHYKIVSATGKKRETESKTKTFVRRKAIK